MASRGYSQPGFRHDKGCRLLRILPVRQMRRQDQIAVQTDVVADVADDEDLGARDAAYRLAVIWVTENLRLVSEVSTSECAIPRVCAKTQDPPRQS